MSKIHAFPLLTIEHFITRETKRLSSNDNDLYDLLPPLSLSPNCTFPRHWGQSTLHGQQQHKQITSQTQRLHHAATASPHSSPTRSNPTLSAISFFPLHLYRYHQYQTTYDQRPGEAQLINGADPFGFLL
jgi:hypothetical protein